jgi:hypothetical protein
LAASWRLTVRDGPRVGRERFRELDTALDALEARGRELERSADGKPVNSPLGRTYEPVQVVAARVELKGPRVRAGVDVRGDGSAEAFTGRVRRRLVTQRDGESAYDALRRELRP